MLNKTRLAALAAVVIVAIAGVACPPAALAQAQAPATAPAAPPGTITTPAVPGATPAAPAAKAVTSTELVENPYGLEALWKGGDFVARGDADHPDHHVVGQLVHDRVTKLFEQFEDG